MEFFHLLNRGVDKRNVVLDDKDRVRFLHDLYAFNNADVVQHFAQPNRAFEQTSDSRKMLVHIHAFCLMRNHYHLLVSEVIAGGIAAYMKKLNMGYSKYFNERYDRSGALWQGKYKKIRIVRDAQFQYIPYYIHLNPLDYVYPEWRQGRVRNSSKALEYLSNYRWSSHMDYVGIKNFPSIIERRDISRFLGDRACYEKQIVRLIQSEDAGLGLSIE